MAIEISDIQTDATNAELFFHIFWQSRNVPSIRLYRKVTMPEDADHEVIKDAIVSQTRLFTDELRHVYDELRVQFSGCILNKN